MIERIPFGSTGHESSRIIFGAAALGSGNHDLGQKVLATLLENGINHIDTAARYGDSELVVGPWMKEHRGRFFLATKTGERTYDGAKEGIHNSLRRLDVGTIDMIQFHNLVDADGWATAMGPGGALEAAVEARDQGLVRFIGVTGHGWDVARRHIESLERFEFDSVLLPYNYPMMSHSEYAGDFEALLALCTERGVAVQTIKSIARRRWQAEPERRYSWYEPLREPAAIDAAVQWVLQRPGIFLNTSSDATLLRTMLEAATAEPEVRSDDAMAGLSHGLEMEPLFEAGQNAI
ncbi:MAG: aldo/keto reductase [Acidobacteriota bacterium]|nr:aldo/keto reductase [Acidobacteriota bacterium]